ncbi:hypothetical protein BLA29_007978, partial [Euroglyphus maynei]
MQVYTRFILNSESKIDSLNSLNNFTFVGPGTADGHQMTEESRVLCIARRLPNSEQHSSGNSGQTKFQIKQFSTRLDIYGCITNVDWSTMSSNNINIQKQITYLRNNLTANRLFHDSVHKEDLNKVQQHLKEAIINAGGSSPAAVSKIYRLKVGPDQYAKVLTKTKLLPNNSMMAKHSIFFEQNTLLSVKKEEDDQSVNENRANTNSSGNHNIGSSPKHPIFFEQNTLLPVKKEEDDQSINQNRGGGNHNIGSSPNTTQ